MSRRATNQRKGGSPSSTRGKRCAKRPGKPPALKTPGTGRRGWMMDDGGQRSEVRGQRSEARGQRTEDGGRMTETGEQTGGKRNKVSHCLRSSCLKSLRPLRPFVPLPSRFGPQFPSRAVNALYAPRGHRLPAQGWRLCAYLGCLLPSAKQPQRGCGLCTHALRFRKSRNFSVSAFQRFSFLGTRFSFLGMK